MTQTSATLKSRFKKLTEADIRGMTDSGSFSKGKSYYSNGYLTQTTLSEAVLRGRCRGSGDELYRVEATLVPVDAKGSEALADYDCDCPRGGFCKHIVALLLNWIYEPQDFATRSPLATLLKDKSKEELLALITEAIKREPDFEDVIILLADVPLTGKKGGQATKRSVDLATVRRQVDAAFATNDFKWGSTGRVVDKLYKVRATGDTYAEAAQWANAVSVYSILTQNVMEHYNELDDSNGDLGGFFYECIEKLGECFTEQGTLPPDQRLPAPARKELLRLLYDVWKFGSAYGVDYDSEVVLDTVTDDEKLVLETWVRQDIEPGTSYAAQANNQMLLNLLGILREPDGIDSMEMIEEYRAAGLYREVIERLLEINHVDEALSEAKDHLTETYDVLWFADQLLKQGKEWVEEAFVLVEARATLPTKPNRVLPIYENQHLKSWLSQNYAKYGQADRALQIELEGFKASPSIQAYQTLRDLAKLPEYKGVSWEKLRTQMLDILRARNEWQVLLSIYLEDGDVRRALDILAANQPQTLASSYNYDPSRILAVARAAEKDYPTDAIQLYKGVVEKLIVQRSRPYYAQAAEYLAKIRTLYLRLEHAAPWRDFINEFRSQHKSLKALKEELDKYGLA